MLDKKANISIRDSHIEEKAPNNVRWLLLRQLTKLKLKATVASEHEVDIKNYHIRNKSDIFLLFVNTYLPKTCYMPDIVSDSGSTEVSKIKSLP